MSDHHLPGEPPVPLILRRSARARRISLRISSLDGRVTLTLPGRVPESEALAFAEEKADWIRSHLANHPGLAPVAIGGRLPVEGQELEILAGQGRAVRREAGRIYVPDPRRAQTSGTLPARAGPRSFGGGVRSLCGPSGTALYAYFVAGYPVALGVLFGARVR